MSESGPRDARTVERALTGLESAVGRLIAELDRARARAEKAEAAHRDLQKGLRAARVDGSNAAEIESRLAELARENDRLRKLIREGRRRAEAIRSRLRAIEDEAARGGD